MEIDLQQCFRVLELEPGVSTAAVKRAYRELVKVWHPDRFASGSHSQSIAQEKLKEINEAYERLCKKRPPEMEAGVASGGGKAAETCDSDAGPAKGGPSQAHWSSDPDGDSAERAEKTHAKMGVAEDDAADGAARTSGAGNAGNDSQSAHRAGSGAGAASDGEEVTAAGPGPVSVWRFWAFAALLCVVFLALWFGTAPQRHGLPNPSVSSGSARSGEAGPRAVGLPDLQGSGAAGSQPSGPEGGTESTEPGEVSRARIGVSSAEARPGHEHSSGAREFQTEGIPVRPDGAELPGESPSRAHPSSAGSRASIPVPSAEPRAAEFQANALLEASASAGLYFTIGSTRDEVVAVQGIPDAYNPTRLQYGSSIVEFKNDRVDSWFNGNPRLKARMPLGLLGAKLRYFTFGSRKDEVIAIQGEPDSYTLTTFHYGLSTVFFRNDRVESWRDSDSRLKARVFPTLPSLREPPRTAVVGEISAKAPTAPAGPQSAPK